MPWLQGGLQGGIGDVKERWGERQNKTKRIAVHTPPGVTCRKKMTHPLIDPAGPQQQRKSTTNHHTQRKLDTEVNDVIPYRINLLHHLRREARRRHRRSPLPRRRRRQHPRRPTDHPRSRACTGMVWRRQQRRRQRAFGCVCTRVYGTLSLLCVCLSVLLRPIGTSLINFRALARHPLRKQHTETRKLRRNSWPQSRHITP